MEDNSEPRASRRSCCVAYAIRGMHRSLSYLFLIARGDDVVFCSLVSFRRYISELTVPGFGRPMQLLRGDVDRFQGLTVYVRVDFLAYRQRINGCGCCEIIVVRICSSSHNFYVFGVYRNPVNFLLFVDDYE